MPSSRGLCVACNEAFQENGELASIPDASKVAFDVAHRRVWRICERCGEWNLLGQEASAAALPELEARFAAAAKAPGEAGFAPAHVGKALELVRIGGTAAQDRNDLAALRRRTQIDREVKIGIVGAVLFLAVYAGLYVASPRQIPRDLLLFATMRFAWLMAEWRRGVRPSRLSLYLSSGFLLVALGVVVAFSGRYDLMTSLILGPLAGVIFVKFKPPAFIAMLSNGKAIGLSKRQLRRVTLSWIAEMDGVSLHDLPWSLSLSTKDTARVFRRMVYSIPPLLVMPAMTEQAYDLLRSVGGLRGLLHALDGFRRDNDGRVVVADLPKIYLVALDLALAEPNAPRGPDYQLRQRANEASAIAREAEALDGQVEE